MGNDVKAKNKRIWQKESGYQEIVLAPLHPMFQDFVHNISQKVSGIQNIGTFSVYRAGLRVEWSLVLIKPIWVTFCLT
jgi:hypothetical protein